jgi:hypothetical protein
MAASSSALGKFSSVMLFSAVAMLAVSVRHHGRASAVAAPIACAEFASDNWKIATGFGKGGTASKAWNFNPGDHVQIEFDFEEGSYLLDVVNGSSATEAPAEISGPMTITADLRAVGPLSVVLTKTSDTPGTQARVTAARCEPASPAL